MEYLRLSTAYVIRTVGSGLFLAFLHAQSVLAQGSNTSQPLVIPRGEIPLIQPLDDRTNSLPVGNPQDPLSAFFAYFNMSWPWVIGVAAGIAVLQALVGGMQIMLSGSDAGARSAGKERLMWALAGLLLIGLSGMILEILNPLFFRQA